MLGLLPGVLVLKEIMSTQRMIKLYGIKPDLLERLVKYELLRANSFSRYTLDDYLSGFLQDRDRSLHYYCDPILQHIYICRHIWSVLDGTKALDLES